MGIFGLGNAGCRVARTAVMLQVVPNADPTRLAGPQPVELLKPHIATVGELLTHLLTSHIGTHVGHLQRR